MDHDDIQEIEEKRNHLNALTHEMTQTADGSIINCRCTFSTDSDLYVFLFIKCLKILVFFDMIYVLKQLT